MNKCGKFGKAKFNTKHEADRRIEEIRKEAASKKEVPVRSYFCGYCGKWHLTKRSKPRTTRILKHLSGKSFDYLK